MKQAGGGGSSEGFRSSSAVAREGRRGERVDNDDGKHYFSPNTNTLFINY